MGCEKHNRPGRRSDRAIAELAAKQHGLVTRSQLASAGLGDHAIDNRLLSGRLHPVHRGIYLVGHTGALPHAPEMAAVLACGGGAVVSHRSAALTWALLPGQAAERRLPILAGTGRWPRVEITVPGRDPGLKPGIHIHRVRVLDRAEARSCNGIPTMSPARTLLDLASTASPQHLERATAEARRRHLASEDELRSLLARHRGRRGAGVLRQLLERDAPPALTRSVAEDRFLAVVRATPIPEPEVNVLIGRYEVDFLWRPQRLMVEVDGFEVHSSRTEFESDRLRDAELQASGFRVIRVTWQQLTRQPSAMLARLGEALACHWV
ncbi:MAG: type IV toxin-antitoxin system AbiEi family antitoxin domain-containing protein [Solirubrobacterales bacterium]